MKNYDPKIARAMQHLDDDMILNSSYEPKRRRAAPWAALAACLALVILATTVVPGFFGAGKVEAIVALDVNPSMEINVDGREKVVSVTPLNDDAVKVIGDMDLEKVDLDVAVNAIVGSMLKNGYLTMDRNSILVSVDSRDAVRAAALQKKVSDDVSQLLDASNIQASVLTQSFDKGAAEPMANALPVSDAKDALVRKLLTLNMTDAHGVPYTYNHLASLTVHELKQLVESRAMTVDNVTSTGTAATSGYIGKDAAYQAALQHAGVAAGSATLVEWELDHDDGQMVYDLEFRVGATEYDYEVNAVTGAIVEWDRDFDDDRYDDDWDDRYDDPFDEGHDGYYPPDSTAGMLDPDVLLGKALDQFGLSRSDIHDLDVEYDSENGRNVCEISFDSGNMEYEVKLDPVTGDVLFYESERD